MDQASDVWGGIAAESPDLASVAGALIGVCALFYIGAWLTAKLLRLSPDRKKQDEYRLSCLSSLRLGGQATLYVVQAGSRALLVGNGQRGVTLLAELDDPMAQADEDDAEADLGSVAAQDAEPSPPIPDPISADFDPDGTQPMAALASSAAPKTVSRYSLPNMRFLGGAFVLFSLFFGGTPAMAQDFGPPLPPADITDESPFDTRVTAPEDDGLSLSDDGIRFEISSPEGKGGFGSAFKVAMGLTLLMFIPAILTSLTAFTRIVIVLSFARRAVGSGTLPPNQVIIGLALFLTMFVMAPVGKRIHATAYQPYDRGEINEIQALEVAMDLIKGFMVKNTRDKDLSLFVELSHTPTPKTISDLPFWVAAPAFIISELRTAFLMAFAIYLPFLVVDLVVASALLSVGLIMVPPPLISSPLKILLFVLADGWYLLSKGLVLSFGTVS